MPDKNPLTDDHFNRLKESDDLLNTAEAQIDMAKRAGIPIPGAEEQQRELREQVKRIRQVYFPGRM